MWNYLEIDLCEPARSTAASCTHDDNKMRHMKPFVPKDKQTHSTLTRPKLFAESERNVDHMSVYAPFKNSCHRTQTKWTVPCFFGYFRYTMLTENEKRFEFVIRRRDDVNLMTWSSNVEPFIYYISWLQIGPTLFSRLFLKRTTLYLIEITRHLKTPKTTLVINESDTIIYPLTSRHTPMCRTRMRFGNDRLILPNTVGRNSSKTFFKSILSKIVRQTHVSLTREPFF